MMRDWDFLQLSPDQSICCWNYILNAQMLWLWHKSFL